MSAAIRPKHCRIYQNGNAMSVHVNRELTDEIKECFPPKEDYFMVFDQVKETLTIFKPRVP